MRLYIEQCNGRGEVNVPDGYIAAINLPNGVAAETAFTDQSKWHDYLFIGPLTIVSEKPLENIAMVMVAELPTDNE